MVSDGTLNEKQFSNHIGFAQKYDSDVGEYRGPSLPYDTRTAKGSLTGHFDPAVPLYHGTNADLKPGDMVEPGKRKVTEPDKKGLTRNGRRLNAYATTNKRVAENYSASGKVYRVQPTGPVSADMAYLEPHDPVGVQQKIESGKYSVVKSPRAFRVVG